jgi:hypothetical protein
MLKIAILLIVAGVAFAGILALVRIWLGADGADVEVSTGLIHAIAVARFLERILLIAGSVILLVNIVMRLFGRNAN